MVFVVLVVGGCAWCCSTLAPPELLTTPRRRFFSMRQQPVGGTCWATSPSAMLGAPTRFASHPSRVYGHPFWIWLSRQGVTGGASSSFPDVVPPSLSQLQPSRCLPHQSDAVHHCLEEDEAPRPLDCVSPAAPQPAPSHRTTFLWRFASRRLGPSA